MVVGLALLVSLEFTILTTQLPSSPIKRLALDAMQFFHLMRNFVGNVERNRNLDKFILNILQRPAMKHMQYFILFYTMINF